MRFDTVIKGGTIVTASDTYGSDIGIVAGRISAIAQPLPIENAGEVIDATGMLVMPGGIDVHTHLDMPFGGTTSADDFETGTIAAAFGGTTTLIDFAIQQKGQSLRQAFETWMKKADRKAAIDYAFHCIITDLGDAQLEEMGALIQEGVSSFKLFMAYPGVLMVDDATIFRAMSQAAKHGGLICMHAENGGAIDVLVRRALAEGKRAPKYHALTRPTTAEGEAVNRAIALAEMAGSPVYIVHLSSNDALEKSVRLAIADYRPTRKRVPNICICRWRIWMSRALKARNTYLLRRCGKNGTKKNYGKGWPAIRCKSSRLTTAPLLQRAKRTRQG